MNTKWLMIQEHGNVADNGKTMISQVVVEEHGWESPEAATRSWWQRGVYSHGNYRPFANGRQETTDVSAIPGYAQIGITAITTRIYFVLVPSDPPGSVSTEHQVTHLALV